MRGQVPFDWLSEKVEWFLSRWWGGAIYFISWVVSFWFGGWDWMDRWVYITGGIILILLVGGARRSSKAMHVKLDDIDEREDLNRIEELTEEEIERKRK